MFSPPILLTIFFFYLKIFSTQNFVGPKVVSCQQLFSGSKLFGIKSFFYQTFFLSPKFFWTQNFFGPKIFLVVNFKGLQIFMELQIFFWHKIYWTQKNVGPKTYLDPIFFWNQNFVWHKIFWDPKCSWEWSLTLALAQLVLSLYFFF